MWLLVSMWRTSCVLSSKAQSEPGRRKGRTSSASVELRLLLRGQRNRAPPTHLDSGGGVQTQSMFGPSLWITESVDTWRPPVLQLEVILPSAETSKYTTPVKLLRLGTNLSCNQHFRNLSFFLSFMAVCISSYLFWPFLSFWRFILTKAQPTLGHLLMRVPNHQLKKNL